MWRKKYVESFPNILRKNFRDWQNYQERKDEEWYDLIDDFAKQVNNKHTIYSTNLEAITKSYDVIKVSIGNIESKLAGLDLRGYNNGNNIKIVPLYYQKT